MVLFAICEFILKIHLIGRTRKIVFITNKATNQESAFLVPAEYNKNITICLTVVLKKYMLTYYYKLCSNKIEI